MAAGAEAECIPDGITADRLQETISARLAQPGAALLSLKALRKDIEPTLGLEPGQLKACKGTVKQMVFAAMQAAAAPVKAAETDHRPDVADEWLAAVEPAPEVAQGLAKPKATGRSAAMLLMPSLAEFLGESELARSEVRKLPSMDSSAAVLALGFIAFQGPLDMRRCADYQEVVGLYPGEAASEVQGQRQA
jgi:hypothetical protein